MSAYKEIKKPQYRKQLDEDEINKRMVIRAALVTLLSVGVVIVLGFHTYWAVMLMINNVHGYFLINLFVGPVTLLLNGFLTFKILSYFNTVLLDNHIDADHKKYI